MADHDETSRARVVPGAPVTTHPAGPAPTPDRKVLRAVHQGLLGVDDGDHPAAASARKPSASTTTAAPADTLAVRRRS